MGEGKEEEEDVAVVSEGVGNIRPPRCSQTGQTRRREREGGREGSFNEDIYTTNEKKERKRDREREREREGREGESGEDFQWEGKLV